MSVLLVMAPGALLAVLPWFEDAQRRVAGIRHEGAGSRVFGFRRQRLAAIADADDFFARHFTDLCGRAGFSGFG
jgi:hypothetical protein